MRFEEKEPGSIFPSGGADIRKFGTDLLKVAFMYPVFDFP